MVDLCDPLRLEPVLYLQWLKVAHSFKKVKKKP